MLLIILIVAAAVMTATVATPVTRHARSRAMRQPLPADPAAEAELISITINHPVTLGRTRVVEPDDFTVETHQQIWAAITAQRDLDDSTDTHNPATFSDQVAETLTGPAADTYEQLRAMNVDPARLMRAGKAVLARSSDRDTYRGLLPVEVTGAEGEGVRRIDPGWSRARPVGLWLIMASWAAMAVIAVNMTGRVLPAAATFVAGIGLAVLAAVDVDTLWLDKRTLGFAAGTAWTFIGADMVLGNPAPLIIGMIATVAMAVIFEGVNLVIRAVTGRHGAGSGDTLALVLAAGVPAAAFTSLTIAPLTIGAAMLTSAVAGTIGRTGDGQLPPAAALIPHLAAVTPAAAFVVAHTLGLAPLG